MKDFKLKVLSVIGPPNLAQEPRTVAVRQILDYWGYDHQQKVDPLWTGMSCKLVGYFEMVKELDESYTHVMLCDARDVVVLASPERVMEEWFKFGHPWVFNAERNIWPVSSYTPEEYPTPPGLFRYINEGVSIGERAYIKEWYSKWTNGFTTTPTDFTGSCQHWMAKRFVRHYPDLIKIDQDCELFQCVAGAFHLEVSPGFAHNEDTGTSPLVIHYNGGNDITHPKWSNIWRHWIQ